MIRALALLALSTAALFAQAVPRIAIAAPDAGLIVGETVQLVVVVRDAAGNIVPNPTVNWVATQPNPLRVDNRGAATAVGVGLGIVTASSGGFNASVQLQCMPSRIDLQPDDKQITVGEQIRFDAKALDKSGQPIPNVTFNWQISGANGGQINAARIDQTGLFTAVGTGIITVRARIDVSGGGLPGRVQWLWGSATVRIEPKQFYRVRRLLGSEETRHSFNIRSLGRVAVINDSGQFAVTASLDGAASAVLAYDRGVTRMVLQGGTRLLGGLTDTPDGISINNQGDILSRFWTSNSAVIALQTRDGTRPVALQGQAAAGVFSIRPDVITSSSLNDLDQIVFRGSYTLPGSTQTYNGLFRLTDRNYELLVSNENPLPGLSGTDFTFSQFGIDNQGAVYFLATTSTAQRLYRILLSGQPTQLLANARSLQTQSFAIAREGGVAVVADIDGQRRLVRFRDTKSTETDGNGIGTIYQVSESAGVLYNLCSSPGCGLYRWKEGAPIPLLIQGRLAINGEPVTGIQAASIGSAGDLTVQVTTSDTPLLLMRQSGATWNRLLQSGDRIDTDAAVQLPYSNVLVRTTPGGPLYLALGNPQSLFTYEGGALIPQILLGDRLPDSTAFNGSVTGTALGGVLLHTAGAAYRFNNGVVETLFKPGMSLPGNATLTSVNVRTANTRGSLALTANFSLSGGANGTAFYLYENGAFTEIVRYGTRASNGQTFDNVSSAFIDEQSRVAFNARVNGQPQDTAFLFANGRLENLFPPGRMQVGGVSLSSFNLRAGRGNKFFAFASVPGGQDQTIIEHAGERWNLTVSNQDTMPDGSTNNGISTWDANALGDVAFATQSATPLALSVRTASGEVRQVMSLLSPAPGGDYIQTIRDIDFRDDGLIYFTAFESTGRFAIYVAEPLQ